MLLEYTYVAFFGFVAVALGFILVWVSRLLQPRKFKLGRDTTYECGEIPVGQSWSQFNIRFYIFALSFVIFDVETIFLIPWAVVFKQLGPLAFVEGAVFVAILILGLVYAWKKDALRWV
jgi:NADH:ubiquinone oxidoreductase subunit 3 (subunit A)